MKNLLLAIAFIGCISLTTKAASVITKTTFGTECCKDGDGGKKCTKKDCKHNSKECADHKDNKATASKKACCADKTAAKKSCCASKNDASCDKSKTTDAKKAPAIKDDKKK